MQYKQVLYLSDYTNELTCSENTRRFNNSEIFSDIMSNVPTASFQMSFVATVIRLRE